MFWILSSAQTDYELSRNKALNKDEIFYSKLIPEIENMQ